MDAARWVIAVSTAVIAVMLVTFTVIFLQILGTLKQDLRSLAERVDRKIQGFENLGKALLGLPADEAANPLRPRRLPWILRGAAFATALWKNFQKRR